MMQTIALALASAQPVVLQTVPLVPQQAVSAAPTQAESVALIEANLRGQLIDPDSAKFEWPYGFVQGEYKPMLGRRVSGSITCGTVNSRNRFGGYVGRTAVIGVIVGNSVIRADVDDTEYFSTGVVWDQCRKLGMGVLPR